MSLSPEKSPPPPIHQIFAQVSAGYDLVNWAMTGGQDRRWRKEAAQECLAPFAWGKPRNILDLCCGTGDLSLYLAQQAGEGCEIIGLDYSQPMLDLAAQKGAQRGLGLKWIQGDAAHLPFADHHFDCLAISFGFRNLTYQNPAAQSHLAELIRVLRPGGRLVVLETSQPKSKWIGAFYHFYLRVGVGFLGSVLTRKPVAYGYLADSALGFYSPAQLEELLVGVGFSQVRFRPLMWGAIGIFVAIK